MAKPIKVTYIVSDLAVGGAEVMLCKLLAGTDRDRFEPVVVSLMDRGPLREKIEGVGFPVYTIGVKPNLPTPLDLFPLIRLLRRLQPDLIVGWMYHGCLAAQLSSMYSLKSSKVLWSIHYSVSSLVSEKRLTAAVIKACALLSRRPAKIVFVSRDGQSKHRLLGFHTENSCVIPNGIDADEFRPRAGMRASVRSEFGLPDDAVIIGMVSRYHPMKDYPNLIRAAAILSQNYPQTRFMLIGRGADSNNRELLGLIENCGVAGQVHLLGERHDIPRLVAALDIFSLSSAYGESFPTVIVEAMASAVPCAVTDVGDASWIVGTTGHVVPPRNPEALAAAWSALIAMTAEERGALGLSARARVCELFPIESFVRAYEALFDVINGSRINTEASKHIATGPKEEVV